MDLDGFREITDMNGHGKGGNMSKEGGGTIWRQGTPAWASASILMIRRFLKA